MQPLIMWATPLLDKWMHERSIVLNNEAFSVMSTGLILLNSWQGFSVVQTIPVHSSITLRTHVSLPVRGLQDTPASSECRQLCSPQALFGHCSRVSSLPVQRTSSNHTRPERLPKCAWPHALATPLQRKGVVHKNRRFALYYYYWNEKQMYWQATIYKTRGTVHCICLI